MSSRSEPVQATTSATDCALFHDPQLTASESDGPSSTAESIRDELRSLSVRQAQVRQRIQHLRHALLELVHVFGPEILMTGGPSPDVGSRALSRGATKLVDFLRRALCRVPHDWVTIDEVIECIREESPAALARFINPNVAVSNALRVLHRNGEIEAARNEQPAKWRWVGQAKAKAKSSA